MDNHRSPLGRIPMPMFNGSIGPGYEYRRRTTLQMRISAAALSTMRIRLRS
jgi:hypothetical protein